MNVEMCEMCRPDTHALCDFDKVHLKNGAYIPQGHADIELQGNFIRRSVADMFLGEKALPVTVFPPKSTEGNTEDNTTMKSS